MIRSIFDNLSMVTASKRALVYGIIYFQFQRNFGSFDYFDIFVWNLFWGYIDYLGNVVKETATKLSNQTNRLEKYINVPFLNQNH